MAGCKMLVKEMLVNPLVLRSGSADMDFNRAWEIADAKARAISADPMLLAWFNKRTGEYSPRVE